MVNDTFARPPHELLSLRIKDVQFKVSSSTGMHYAEVHLLESMTKPRTLPLIFSIPYIKDWIDSHLGAMSKMLFYSHLLVTITLATAY